MYPDEFFHKLEGCDEKEMAEQMCQYFFEQDAANSERTIDQQLCNEYIRTIEQFRIFLDPYGVTYKVPVITKSIEENIDNVRRFFRGVQTGDSLFR